MPQFSAGLTDALNSMQNRAYQQAEIDKIRQAVTFSNLKQQLEEQEREKTERARAEAISQYPQLTAPPEGGAQPPPPGQPSVPMQQATAPSPMAMSGGMGLTPPPTPGGPAPAAGMGGMAAPQPAGWRPGATAPPSLGGPPGGPPQGGAGGPGALAPPPGMQQQSIIPNQPDWAAQTIQTLTKKGLPPQEIYRVLEQMAPIRDAHNKEVMQTYMIEMKAAQAGELAARAEKERLQGEMAGKPKPATPTGFQKEAADLYGEGTPEYKRALEKHVARMDAPPKYMVQGTAAAGDYGKVFDKMNPRQQAVVDWYATMDLGGDRTWRVGLSRVKGGAEIIKAVDEHVPEMAASLGLTAADIGTNKAIRVASQSALTQNTKDLATLKPYVNMLHQNADILKGLAKKAIATNAALANKPINWLRTHAADSPDVAEYLAQVEIVKNEATRVISNPRLVGQMTDTARQEIESVINGNMPLNATDRVLERIKNDGDRRLTTMEAQQGALEGRIKEMYPGGGGQTKPEGSKPTGAPKKGDVEDGYRFKGGDPAKRESWEKV
jgi:hypothetical protein